MSICPKNKSSKARRDKRRANWKMGAVNLVKCVFAPWPDYEALMRENDIPLYGLESFDPIKEFDFIGFTIQYELCYTIIRNMLDLAGRPVPAA